MGTAKIAVIRGDGIGTEVIEEGLKVLREVGREFGIFWKFTEFPWGSAYFMKHGRMMPADAIDKLTTFDAIYLGAIGHPEIQDHITLNGLLLPIRRAFDQYACVRPSLLYPGIESPLRRYKAGDIDLVVVRENTEGEYANVGGFQYAGSADEIGIQTAVFTRRGCERVIRYAFDLARKRDRKHRVTSVTKSNAQGYGMVLWDRVFRVVANDYPEIETESLLIDAACMDFVRRTETFDVVVASNLFGDILTDLGAIVTGSLGLAPSGNINPERKFPSMFEPVHGSAPDIAGKGIANPLAAILSAVMLMAHLGEQAAATTTQEAVKKVIRSGQTLTPDLGGKASTSEVGNAIIREL